MPDHSSWEECPSGLVTGMAGHLRRRRRQTRRRPFIYAGMTLLLLVSFVGIGLINRTGRESQGSMNCRKAVPLFAKYHAKSLDASSADRVREHLSRCPKCREHYEELYPSEARNREATKPGLLAAVTRFPLGAP